MHKMLAGIVFTFLGGPVWAEPVTIAALGDSLTQGYGLPEADGLVPQLDTWLKSQGADVTLINAGVSGDTTTGGAARVEWTLTPDVDAMIVTLGGNDLLRGIAPDVARANLTKILQVAQAANVKVLLIGLSAPSNYGPDYKTAFDAIYPELAAEYGTSYAPNFLTGVMKKDGQVDLRLMQGDAIHPNAMGVSQIVTELGPLVLGLINEDRQTETREDAQSGG